jgi:hypothetical protein
MLEIGATMVCSMQRQGGRATSYVRGIRALEIVPALGGQVAGILDPSPSPSPKCWTTQDYSPSSSFVDKVRLRACADARRWIRGL